MEDEDEEEEDEIEEIDINDIDKDERELNKLRDILKSKDDSSKVSEVEIPLDDFIGNE